jgi:hypothetical protein
MIKSACNEILYQRLKTRYSCQDAGSVRINAAKLKHFLKPPLGEVGGAAQKKAISVKTKMAVCDDD